jgi:hypothetical protein
MPLKGDIKTFSISAVGRMIHAEKKTGLLKVISGEHRTVIYFKKGGIVFVDGDLAKDLSLGSLLKANNLINEEKIQQSLEIARAAGKRLGVILIEQGFLSQEKLIRILHHQFKEALAKVLTWEQGEYTYSDGLDGYVEDIRLEINPIRLVAEAHKWKQYRKLIPNDQVVFQIKGGALQSKSFSAEGVQRVMLLINGKRTVSQIMADAGLSRLAVYKALAFMLSRGAIVRSQLRVKEQSSRLGTDTIIKFYLNLLHEMMTGLEVELGSKKATSVLEKSLNHSPYYERFLFVFQPGADVPTNFNRINIHLKKQREKVLREDLTKGFNQVAGSLLREECILLGFKASQTTLSRISAALKDLPREHRPLARDIIQFLDHYCANDDLLQGITSLSETMDFGRNLTPDRSQPLSYRVDNSKKTEIISFYSEVIQVIISDLENEIGTKALDLFQNIVRNAEDDYTFLLQFDVKNDIKSNVKRIEAHINSQRRKYGKQDLVMAFQNVLIALLQEENRLLGEKSTQMSILSLEKHLADRTEAKYKTIADQLMGFLRNPTSWT